MSNYLSRLFEKKGVKDVTELSAEERQTFEGWQAILTKGDITVDSIKEFCENQIKRIEMSWLNLDNPSLKNDRLIVQHTVYSTILQAIIGPKLEKEQLERHLEELVKNA